MEAFRFGKLAPKLDYRTLRFRKYLTPLLPAPPASYNVLSQVYQKLGTSDPATLFPIDGNDRIGDCTVAAVAHAITTYQGLLGAMNIMEASAVVDLFHQMGGDDQKGLAELDVLNYWRQDAISGDQILAYASIDAKNHTHIQQAVQLFGGVYLGFQVQQDCLLQFYNQQPWTPGPLLQEGHAVYAVAYDSVGVTVLTWGSIQKGTWAWWDECVDEAYAILPQDARESGFAPGFDFDQLQADLAAVTRSVR